jgi:hypothetical protein
MAIEGLLVRWRQVWEVLRKPAVRRAVSGLVVILSFGYLGAVLARNWDDLIAYDWRIDYRQALLAFLCYSVALGFAVLGWTLIMRHLTPLTSPSKHLKYYAYTNLLKRLPAPLLNIFGRVYFYEQEGIGHSLMVTISLLEWAVIILSGLLVYLVTAPFIPLPPIWRSPLIPASMLILGALLLRPKTLRAVLRLFGQEDAPIAFGYGDLVVWLAVYCMVWIVGGLVLFVGINSIYRLPVARLPAVIGIWIASGLVPTLMLITPVGLGLKELTLSLLLGTLMPSPLAIIVALLMRVGLILFEIAWGLVALSL